MTKLLHAALLLWGAQAIAAAPQLYGAAAYQGPFRAEADDLLLLPGYGLGAGDSVVYRAIVATTDRLTPPQAIPQRSTAALGTADLVSLADAPYSLTVRLPDAIDGSVEYALWVVNAAGEWSNPVSINDARPLWITPDEIRLDASSGRAAPRLKLVGRNLQPRVGQSAMVRLIGTSHRYALPTLTSRTGALDRYVAEVRLPAGIVPGRYDVQFSRDGENWVPLIGTPHTHGQSLRVLAARPPTRTFAVGEYTFGDCNPAGGHCRAVAAPCRPPAGGGLDQTACITAAIAAARAAGGGAVTFRAGTGMLVDPGAWPPGSLYSTKGVSADGMLVPAGVDLQGTSGARTLILRAAAWPLALPSFALQGANSVHGLRFRDARVYTPEESGAPALALGTRWDRALAYRADDPLAVSHVTIVDNSFEFPFYAIANGGLAIDHLLITGNEFGAYKTAIMLEAETWNAAYRYELRDTAITHNRFHPGSYLDAAIGQGAIATQLGGSTRVDFSDNDADGSSTRYLQHPDIDAHGWRAAYFWSLSDNIEMLLVAHNSASCTGDKDGDGEFIAYDNNHNRPGFLELVAPVLSAGTDATAGASTVTVRGSLLAQQHSYGRNVDVHPTERYYLGDWLQVVQGTGVGQARKITAIRAAAAAGAPAVTFTVRPAFDVLPAADSRVTDGRQLWQVYTVDNRVDHRAPLCRKSNRTRRAGGLITLSARSSDTDVEGNSLYDSSGIQIVHQFMLTDTAARVSEPNSMTQFATEIRGNLLDGAYDDRDSSPQAESGISVDLAATPHTEPPPTLSHGLSISHNAVLRVGALAGAIAIRPSWHVGPASPQLPGVRPWKLTNATLIYHNELTAPTSITGSGPIMGPAIGLSAGEAKAPIGWRTVLYANRCANSARAYARLADFGTQTVRYCPVSGVTSARQDSHSCECYPAAVNAVASNALVSTAEVDAAATDIAVQTERNSLAAAPDGTAHVRFEIVNRGRIAASGVTLSAEPSAGINVRSVDAHAAACQFVERVALCRLDTIQAGAHVPISAELTFAGATSTRDQAAPGNVQFSVTHREPDPVAGNDSVSVSVVGGDK